MKTFVQLITVFAVFSLAAADVALAEKAVGLSPPVTSQPAAEVKEKRLVIETARDDARLDRALKMAERYIDRYARLAKHAGAGGASRVLVIPAGEIEVEKLLEIMEDMNIMSRVLDKKLVKAHLTGDYRRHFSVADVFGSDVPMIKSMYLEGYGALFLSKVNFPLSPSAKAEKEEPTEDVDPIWEQAKKEIYTRHEEEECGGCPPSEGEQEYDREKVEELKEQLIKTLAHAANIRSLGPDEWVILTVTGGGRRSRTISLLSVIAKKVQANVQPFEENSKLTLPGPYSPTVMTIRVKKADVDAFAKDKLDFEAFRQKVQLFTY